MEDGDEPKMVRLVPVGPMVGEVYSCKVMFGRIWVFSSPGVGLGFMRLLDERLRHLKSYLKAYFLEGTAWLGTVSVSLRIIREQLMPDGNWEPTCNTVKTEEGVI